MSLNNSQITWTGQIFSAGKSLQFSILIQLKRYIGPTGHQTYRALVIINPAAAAPAPPILPNSR